MKNRTDSVALAKEQFRSNARFFEHCLEEVFSQTEWPRETLVTFEVRPEESTVWLDVDLPEIEDMPDKVYSVNARELISMKSHDTESGPGKLR
ncbi:hypothetical protein [Klebsiella pneumoniae]|uniref:hypothetical protein n=1 Tax=Klebsiella pneumoniae TaxID=573 RepID=UPI001E30F94F|nr:hypothetical protein [Klebsiella pneumoniae]